MTYILSNSPELEREIALIKRGQEIIRIEQVVKTRTDIYSTRNPNTCYILTDLTDVHTRLYESDTTLVSQLEETKQNNFGISYNQTSIVALSNHLFSGTQPMVGVEMLALKTAIRKNAKSESSLNRL
jgi:hypothetical protein